MDKTLIVKTGATGDVLRTTPLLHVIEGEIHWLTLDYNMTILPTDCVCLTRVFSIEQDLDEIKTHSYHNIISLEEDKNICAIISQLKFDNLTGIYLKDDKIQYTPDSASFFDMSLISKLGKDKADSLKLSNTFSYQDLIFSLVGKEFAGQRYWTRPLKTLFKKCGNRIGIEARAGERWQGKIWFGYDALANSLQKQGYEVIFFSQRVRLEEYVADIGSCDFIITGDTLAMHVAMAFEIPVLAIFTCTSPAEIYDYGILEKIVNPDLKNCFYKTSLMPENSTSIEFATVLERFRQMAAKRRFVKEVH